MEACLAVLGRGLGDEKRAHRAYATIQTYTIGFAALEAAREAHTVEQPRPAPRSAAARELATYASPGQFRVGLRYLLLGISGTT
jgi:hypothetical protein